LLSKGVTQEIEGVKKLSKLLLISFYLQAIFLNGIAHLLFKINPTEHFGRSSSLG
jgi:hypothetical protein